MAYSYYRSQAPGWGTQQFQFGAPPMPGYQPQPTWTGQDFYSAHALGGDPMLYQDTISRFSSGMGGMAKHDAKMWHYRAYGGLGEVTHMMPQEVGAAAAYEAYRQIKYGSGMYQFLYGDYDRQREALRGLAIAEVVRLWQDTGRGFDQYGMQVACDAAAATAYHIASQRELEEGMGLGMGGFGGSYRERRSSFAGYPGSGGFGGGGSVYGGGGSVYGGGGSVYGGGSPLMTSSPIPVPGSPYAHMGGGVPYAGSMGSMGGYASSYGGGYGGYAGSYGSPYAGGLQVGYPMSGMGGYASLPGSPQAIVIPPPSEGSHRHRHRRHHHHHRRHRSHDRYRD